MNRGRPIRTRTHRSSNELQWLDWTTWYQFIGLSNGHQDDMEYDLNERHDISSLAWVMATRTTWNITADPNLF